MMEFHPLTGIGEVTEGDDLPGMLGQAIDRLPVPASPGDVLVVTQKIVSKAEGRSVNLETVTASAQAIELAARTQKDPRLVECILRESSAVVRAGPGLLITRHKLGLVMANAGIDRSNIGPGDDARILLLPQDPDASAQQIARGIHDHFGHPLPVIVSDSFGRPWRQGVTGVAIGVAGMAALIDRRGEIDRDGRVMEVTQVALADLLACAAMMVTGEGAEGIPAVLVRGDFATGTGRATDLVRPLEQDQFQ